MDYRISSIMNSQERWLETMLHINISPEKREKVPNIIFNNFYMPYLTYDPILVDDKLSGLPSDINALASNILEASIKHYAKTNENRFVPFETSSSDLVSAQGYSAGVDYFLKNYDSKSAAYSFTSKGLQTLDSRNSVEKLRFLRKMITPELVEFFNMNFPTPESWVDYWTACQPFIELSNDKIKERHPIGVISQYMV